MAENSAIEWTDATFNPWIGCTKVSPGCDHCYAAQQDSFRRWTPQGWGAGLPRRRTSESLWAQPLKWNEQMFFQCGECGWRGTVCEAEKIGGCCESMRLVPARRRVFCASLADVFDNEVDPAWRADLLFLIEQTPNLDWLLLTKRIGNVYRMVAEASEALAAVHRPLSWPLPNVWLGATIVNQEEADRDIPKLLATPARVRFLSMEPLLGPVDLTCIPMSGHGHHEFDPIITANALKRAPWFPPLPQVNWVIAGGESGPRARPMHPDWARSLRDQCAAAGVPFLFKQWGEHAPTNRTMAEVAASAVKHVAVPFGDGRVFPAALVDRVGKKAAGRVLDGRTHDGFPGAL